MSDFDVPVALFLFKRPDTTLQVLEGILAASPRRLYLIGDGPRTPEEGLQVQACRERVESRLAMSSCEVIRNYAEENRGVYANIAGGAKWVFEREPIAIFLEDDTVPDPTFFAYCEEMLTRYEQDPRVLWACGTNYLERYSPEDGSDYVFTQHMLPCGWASWASKFNAYYDGELELFDQEHINRMRSTYHSQQLYDYDVMRVNVEHARREAGDRFLSWDYQMAFSIRVHDKLGTVPKNNLIINIGDDGEAAHGSTSSFETMSRRFCGIPTHPLEFPLKHPPAMALDRRFEAKTTKIVIPPSSRMRRWGALLFKKLFSVPPDMPTREALHRLRTRSVNWRG